MVIGINHITLAVKNVDASFTFYRDVLGFQPLCKWDLGAYFLIGDFWFCLNLDKSRVLSPCYTRYAFTVENEEFDSMSLRIIDSGAHCFKENTSPSKSLYFLDPDGHKLEIHVGCWKSRVEAKKANPGNWNNLTWYI